MSSPVPIDKLVPPSAPGEIPAEPVEFLKQLDELQEKAGQIDNFSTPAEIGRVLGGLIQALRNQERERLTR